MFHMNIPCNTFFSVITKPFDPDIWLIFVENQQYSQQNNKYKNIHIAHEHFI